MLDRNYSDWRAYLDRLLSVQFRKGHDTGEELNRLLLNYLTFAYTVQEHFALSFRRRFREDEAAKGRYSDFMKRLCEMCWPFAFILDFRGYVQHVGLGIGRSSRKVSDTSVSIEVIVDANTLLSDGCKWTRSKLDGNRRELDLIAILKEFHVQMLQSYGTFVAKTFFPELVPASEFYGKLTREVQERNPEVQMVFFSGEPEVTPEEGGKTSLNMNMVFVPNELYSELGIKIGAPPDASAA